ncbi:MAG: dihydrolipoyl dehydrogenase [Bacteroidales bacterium]|nr:dihydrolipoyl dehydrogenase [Bacteroidales bacterium]
MNYTLAIIGGGPAGYTAAEKAAKKGLSVVLFEKNSIGGVCLNCGCIPTKTLLYSAKLFDHSRNGDKYGISASDVSFSLDKIMSRKNKIIRKLSAGIKARLKSAGVTVVNEHAHIESVSNGLFILKTDNEQYEVSKIILATGSEPSVPPINGIENVDYWTSTDALQIKSIPERIIIVGGGVIGMEFASFFNSMGSKVTVVEMLPEILGNMDKEISQMLREDFQKRGIEFYLNTKVTSFADPKTVCIENEDGIKNLSFDNILIASGRRSVIDKSFVDVLNLEFDNRRLKVNDKMQTSYPNVYACGDITGKMMLAHVAEREAMAAVNNILGNDDLMRFNAVPGVVYTSPEVASVGYTEEELIKSNICFGISKLPMTYAGRFVVENETVQGLCKILFDKNDKILGVHILGNQSSEFIASAGMAIQFGISKEEWSKTIFPHPTVSEILKEAINE